MELIEVEYEVLAPILNHMDALEPDAPLVHPDLGELRHVGGLFSAARHQHRQPTKCRKGDVERVSRKPNGSSSASTPIRRCSTCPWRPTSPSRMEVRRRGRHLDQRAVALHGARPLLPHLQAALNNVRVVVPYVGGGFGGKAGIHLEPLVACLSRKAGGRPVKFQATREEEFSPAALPQRADLAHQDRRAHRRPDHRAGDGDVLGRGAYADYAVNVTRATGYSAAGPYDIPNGRLDAYTVYTNKPYGTAYRGFGHVEFFWGLERHMEWSPRDRHGPLEFRRKNLLKPGSTTITGEVFTEHNGDGASASIPSPKAIGSAPHGGGEGA